MNSQKMDDTRLHDRLLPYGADRVGQALQAVADQQAHVADAAVLDLGQHAQQYLAPPSPCSPATAQDVALPVHGDAERDVDGQAGDLASRIFTLIASMNSTANRVAAALPLGQASSPVGDRVIVSWTPRRRTSRPGARRSPCVSPSPTRRSRSPRSIQRAALTTIFGSKLESSRHRKLRRLGEHRLAGSITGITHCGAGRAWIADGISRLAHYEFGQLASRRLAVSFSRRCGRSVSSGSSCS